MCTHAALRITEFFSPKGVRQRRRRVRFGYLSSSGVGACRKIACSSPVRMRGACGEAHAASSCDAFSFVRSLISRSQLNSTLECFTLVLLRVGVELSCLISRAVNNSTQRLLKGFCRFDTVCCNLVSLHRPDRRGPEPSHAC